MKNQLFKAFKEFANQAISYYTSRGTKEDADAFVIGSEPLKELLLNVRTEKLYLVTYTKHYYDYGNGTKKYPNQMRLVWANTEQEAKDLIRDDLEYSETGGDSVHLYDIEVNEAIVPKNK